MVRVHIEEPRQESQPEPEQFMFNPSQARVPAGPPIQIAGRTFHGGEWVPKEFENLATPAQKQMLHQAHQQSVQNRMGKGPPDKEKMHTTITEHVAGDLSGADAAARRDA